MAIRVNYITYSAGLIYKISYLGPIIQRAI